MSSSSTGSTRTCGVSSRVRRGSPAPSGEQEPARSLQAADGVAEADQPGRPLVLVANVPLLVAVQDLAQDPDRPPHAIEAGMWLRRQVEGPQEDVRSAEATVQPAEI